MKQVQRDSKYIIKRILIGVGIALILANLRKCNVYAEELNPAYINILGYNLPEITNTPWGEVNDIVYDFNYSNYNININNVSSSFYYILFKDSNNYYLLSSNTFDTFCSSNSFNFNSLNFTNSTIQLNNNNDLVCNLSSPGFTEIRILSQDNISDNNFYNDLITNNYFSSHYNNNYNNDFNYSILIQENNISDSNRFLGIYNALSYMNDNFDFVSSSVPIFLDNSQISIPSGYTEIELKENQSVYFVPKNYNDIQIETIDKVNYIDFNYYYKGNVKEGWFPLQNINDLFINNDIPFISESSFSFRDSWFPMYENPGEVGYNYYAYIIINNNVDNSYIRYNSILFDYYIIDDFTTYNENICYINRDSQKQCLDIDFASSINNYWLDGFNDNNDGFVGEQGKTTNKLSDLFNALKYPINWLTNLINNNSCQPIVLSLPFVGGNLRLDCLSSIFKSVLGNYYNIFLYVITGIYAYRITIMNIDTATDVLDPTDDKLEVIEL